MINQTCNWCHADLETDGEEPSHYCPNENCETTRIAFRRNTGKVHLYWSCPYAQDGEKQLNQRRWEVVESWEMDICGFCEDGKTNNPQHESLAKQMKSPNSDPEQAAKEYFGD